MLYILICVLSYMTIHALARARAHTHTHTRERALGNLDPNLGNDTLNPESKP